MVAKGKELVLSAETLAGELAARKPEAVCAQLAKVAEAVCTLTETTAQAVFMVAEKTPGYVNLFSSFLSSSVDIVVYEISCCHVRICVACASRFDDSVCVRVYCWASCKSQMC